MSEATTMHDAFRSAVEDYAACLRERYGERLASIYLVGSLVRSEAVPGLSDVNLLGLFHDAGPNAEEDAVWEEATCRALEERHPGLRWDTGAPAEGEVVGAAPLFTLTPLSLTELRGQDTEEEARDAVLELHWGGRLLWGDDIRGPLPPCLPPRLPHARAWAAHAARDLAWADAHPSAPRLAGHRAAKAALTWCLAVCVVEGQGFTLDSRLIAARFHERHPEWEAWAREFVRARVDPPTLPEHLTPLLEAAHILGDWASTILHTMGQTHHLRC